MAANGVEPTRNIDITRCLEGRTTKRERIVDRWQRLEELHARHEVGNGETGSRLNRDWDIDIEKNTQRSKLGKSEADAEATDSCHGELPFESDEEDALLDRSNGIERGNDIVLLVESEDSADQGCLDLATEEIRRDADSERLNCDDGVRAFQKKLR